MVDGLEATFTQLRFHFRKPIFLFVNLLEPHWRYLPWLPDRLAQLPDEIDPFTATRIAVEFWGPAAMAGKEIDGPVRPAIRALYAAAVRYQDRRFGELLASLRAHLDLDQTLLIVTSDHGENLGAGGRWDHVFAVNDALIRIPLLIRYPRVFPPGQRVPGLCQIVDVPATIADLVPAVRDLQDADGRTLVPARFRPRRYVFAEGDPYYGHLAELSAQAGFERGIAAFAASLRAVRSERYKYVWSSLAAPKLYDLDADPDETENIALTQRGLVARFATALSDWSLALRPYAGGDAGGTRGLSPEERERLRHLGYLK